MRKVSLPLTLRRVPRARRLSSCGSKDDRLISDGSKSVVCPIYWLYRSDCRPRVRFSMVGPPKLAISSIRELLAAVLERLGWCCRLLLLSDIPGELQQPMTCQTLGSKFECAPPAHPAHA